MNSCAARFTCCVGRGGKIYQAHLIAPVGNMVAFKRGNQPQVKARLDECSLPIERATPSPVFKKRAAIQTTNRLQGSIMKRVSGMAAHCAEFFLAVLPFSLILAAAGNSAGHRTSAFELCPGQRRKQLRRP